MQRLSGLLAMIGAAMLLTSAAGAQPQLSPDQKYYTYQQAIAAQQTCTKMQFTQDQYARLNQRAISLVGQVSGAARSLILIQDAEGGILQDIAYRGGCANPRVVQALSLFQRDLAPALAG